PGEPALQQGPRGNVPYPAERRAAVAPRRLSLQLMLAELRERDRDDRHRQYRRTEGVQVAKRALQLRPIVHPRHENYLRVELDAPLPECAELRDDPGRVGVAQQPAAHRGIGGVYGDVERRQAIFDDALNVPGLEV